MTTTTEITLDSLARQINDAHAACESAARSALTHAMRAGELLTQAKQQVPHGQWLPWLQDNFKGSDRTAQVYMRVAHHRAELEANTQTSAGLSLDAAVQLLAEPSTDQQAEEVEFDEVLAAIRAIRDGKASGRQKHVWVTFCFDWMERFTTGKLSLFPPGIVTHQVMIWTACPGAVIGPTFLDLPDDTTREQYMNVGRYLASFE